MKRDAAALAVLTAAFAFPLIFFTGLLANAGDLHLHAAPLRYFCALQLQKGQLPLWLPHIFAGDPFLALSQSGVFYPLTPLFAFFPLNPAVRAFMVFHLFLNAFGAFLFLRAAGRSRPAALWGGAVWGFSFLILSKVALGHMIHLSGYAWTPYALLAVGTGARRPTAGEGILAALVSALQLFSGHPQVWLATVFLMACLFARRTAVSPPNARRKLWTAWTGAGLLLAALIAVQFWPTWEFMGRSNRTGLEHILSPEQSYAFATSYSMDWGRALRGFIDPWRWGRPLTAGFHFPEPLSIYFETCTTYIGLAPLLLALAGLVSAVRRRRWFLPLLAGGFFLVALGRNGPVYPLFWKSLHFLRVPARFYLAVHAGLVLAAASAAESFFRRRRTAWILAVVTLADLWWFGRYFVRVDPGADYWGRTALMTRLQMDLSPPPGALPGRIFTRQNMGNMNKGIFYGLSNVNGYDGLVQRSLLALVGRSQPGVMQETTGVEIFRPDGAALKSFSMACILSTEPLPTAWALAGSAGPVQVYRDPAPLPPLRALFRRETVPDDAALMELMGGGRWNPEESWIQVDPGASRGEKRRISGLVTLLSAERFKPEKMASRWRTGGRPFWAFWSEAFYPGWEVWTSAGRRVAPEEADGYFQCAEIPSAAGDEEKLVWLYRPAIFRAGLLVSVFALLGLAAWSLRRLPTAFFV